MAAACARVHRSIPISSRIRRMYRAEVMPRIPSSRASTRCRRRDPRLAQPRAARPADALLGAARAGGRMRSRVDEGVTTRDSFSTYRHYLHHQSWRAKLRAGTVHGMETQAWYKRPAVHLVRATRPTSRLPLPSTPVFRLGAWDASVRGKPIALSSREGAISAPTHCRRRKGQGAQPMWSAMWGRRLRRHRRPVTRLAGRASPADDVRPQRFSVSLIADRGSRVQWRKPGSNRPTPDSPGRVAARALAAYW